MDFDSIEDLRKWNEEQLKEALGNDNRYYFYLKYGRPAENNNELLLHYILEGGAVGFRQRNTKDSK